MIKVETTHEILEIPDLKMFVRKHEPIWISKEQYDSSIALKKLERLGSVICYPNHRSRTMSKLPKPPVAPIRTSKMSRPHKGGLAPTPTSSAQQMQEAVSQASQAAAQQAAEKAIEALKDQLLVSLPTQPQSSPTPNVEGLEEMIQRAVLNALGSLQVAPGAVVSNQPRVTGPAEPVYIPSNIVDKDIKGNVNVKSETSTSEGLDDASEALKQLRKSKPKNKK